MNLIGIESRQKHQAQHYKLIQKKHFKNASSRTTKSDLICLKPPSNGVKKSGPKPSIFFVAGLPNGIRIVPGQVDCTPKKQEMRPY